METLNLQSGHFLSRPGATDERIRVLEVYLSGLTSELEYLLGDIHASLERLSAAVETLQATSHAVTSTVESGE